MQTLTFGDLNATHHNRAVIIQDGDNTYTGIIETIAHHLDQGVTGVSLDSRPISIQRRHDWPIMVSDKASSEPQAT